MNDNQDLYRRQEELDVTPPAKATVIGLGGVGSWVALDLALAGVEELYIIDPDYIEDHNLNRTPFRQRDIGNDKIDAVAELIYERRNNVQVIPIKDRVEDISPTHRSDIADSVIVDCRDTTEALGDDLSDNVAVSTGYDGLQFTFHENPSYDKIFGDGTDGYETVPSFIAPPQLLASLTTYAVCRSDPKDQENVRTMDFHELMYENMFVPGK